MLKPLRSPAAILLVVLGSLAILHQLFTHFPALPSNLAATLRLTASPSFCTKDVGPGPCCDLFLAAAPCVEECRKEHLSRETFTLTNEYEACSEGCLAVYHGECAREGAASPIDAPQP